MSLEIWPFASEVIEANGDVDGYAKVHQRGSGKKKHAIVPEGANAHVRINGVDYRIRNFRGRPGHTAGAVVEGDGIRLNLDSAHHSNAINMNIFLYRK